MGVLKHADILNSKWITAKITDSSNRVYFEHIKYVIGDYFITDINKITYCFKIEGSRIQTYTHKAIKSCRILDFNTSHYLPVSAADVKEIQDVLAKNSLPKINEKLSKIFKILGSREKEEFSPHMLKDLVKELSTHENEYTDQVRDLKNYLDHLKVDKIITPVRKLSEFIEGDLKETDPKFLGEIVSAYQRTDMEHKQVTNKPITGKIAWLKIGIILGLVIMGVVIAYLVYDSGILEGGIPGLTDFGKPTAEELMKKYTPEQLKIAVDSGEIKYEDLPKEMQRLVDAIKPPALEQ